MIINADSIICDKNKDMKFQKNAEEFIRFCSSENRQTGVKGLLKHNKIQDIAKIIIRHYRLFKKKMFNT